jgi:hypothetical protein
LKKAIVLSTVIVIVLLGATAASACGDKLLHLSRIHRMNARSATVTVLIYSRPDSLLRNAADLHLEKTFQEEGYKVLFVKTQRELTLALQAGVGEVVIADIADAPSIARMSSPVTFLVVPVLGEGYKESELDSRGYAAIIKSATKPGKYLDAVDRALDSKLARQNAKLRTGSTSYQ